MIPLFKKLNLKADNSEVVILNAPESFQLALTELGPLATISEAIAEGKTFHFFMAFVTQQQQVNTMAISIEKAATEDAIIWVCYPKGTSKKYRCDFNRDTGWAVLGELGFEPVRMVAIDEDWSALRFRKVQYIKKMTRSRALSKEGEIKAGISPASS